MEEGLLTYREKNKCAHIDVKTECYFFKFIYLENQAGIYRKKQFYTQIKFERQECMNFPKSNTQVGPSRRPN